MTLTESSSLTVPVIRADSALNTDIARIILQRVSHIVECEGCGNDAWILTDLVLRAEALDIHVAPQCEKCEPVD